MSADTSRAPDALVRELRNAPSKAHPIRSALIGGSVGLAVVYLTARGWWIVAGALLVAMLAWGAWYGSWAAASRRARRGFRRGMQAAGWCWRCHGAHLGKHCPERRVR